MTKRLQSLQKTGTLYHSLTTCVTVRVCTRRSAKMLKLLMVKVTGIDRLRTVNCYAGKPSWMPSDPTHPPKQPSTPTATLLYILLRVYADDNPLLPRWAFHPSSSSHFHPNRFLQIERYLIMALHVHTHRQR